jgi:hypothetical protein
MTQGSGSQHRYSSNETARLVGYDIYLYSLHDWLTLPIRDAIEGAHDGYRNTAGAAARGACYL